MPRNVVLEKPKKFRKMRQEQICFDPLFCDHCEEFRGICGHDTEDDYKLYRKTHITKKVRSL